MQITLENSVNILKWEIKKGLPIAATKPNNISSKDLWTDIW